jgi:hypothetical protein
MKVKLVDKQADKVEAARQKSHDDVEVEYSNL